MERSLPMGSQPADAKEPVRMKQVLIHSISDEIVMNKLK
jgi:hypothetical protein